MTLTLTIRPGPDGTASATRQIQDGSLSIGRTRNNDWMLPDPHRHLSKCHCIITLRSTSWEITDLSTNGTFLNRDPAPIGFQNVRTLRDGDRITLGDYQIDVALYDSSAWEQASAPWPSRTDPRSSPEDIELSIGLAEGDALGIAMALPPGPHDDDAFASPLPAADHAPIGAEHFSPPAARFDILPTNWDQEFAPGNESVNPPSAGSPPSPVSMSIDSEAASPSPVPVVQASPEPAQLPPPVSPPAPGSLPVAEAALPEPAASANASPGPTGTTPPVPEQPGQMMSQSASAALAPADAYAIFLAGAGIAAAAPVDPAAALHDLGQAFRTVVSGLRQVIITRAAIKGEFRIEQTMIQPSGNNPLKFSADDDDALQALLGSRRLGDMPAERALDEAMHDLRTHEIAVSAAMQQATRDLLAALAPGRVERDLPGSTLDKLPGATIWRKARTWDGYVTLYARAMQALDDDFDSIFGKSFVRAYEQAIAELDAQHGDGRHAAVPRRVK